MPDDREMVATLAQLEGERRAVCGEIGQRKARGEVADDLIAQSRALSAQIDELCSQQQAVVEESQSDAGRLTTEVLTNSGQIGALRAEWGGLLARCSLSSPFLAWEWMMSWYETYEDDGAVRCLAIRDVAGDLVGLAPLFLSAHRDPKLGRRQIGFASTYGSSWGSYLQLIHTPDTGEAVAQATTEYLDSIRDEWDCAKFLRMPVEKKSAWSLIGPMVTAGWHVGVGTIRRVAVATLPRDGQDIVAVFPSSKLRTQCRRALRQLQEHHPRHEFRVWAPVDGLAEFTERHAQLNIQRRSQLGLACRFQSPKYHACFTRAAQRFVESGRLRLSCLEIDGEVVATQFWLLSGETLYAWTHAWAPQWADYDISHLLCVESLKGGLREGAREVSFLDGEGRYKYRYGNACHLRMSISAWQTRRKMVRSICEELWGCAFDRFMSRGRQGAAAIVVYALLDGIGGCPGSTF
jgi:CelD/BcsL family acetyltransferase involved in cellulose biosynthesis